MLTLLVVASLASDPIDIAELAPKNSEMVIRVPSADALVRAARGGTLDAFWTQASLKTWAGHYAWQSIVGVMPTLEGQDLTFEDLVWPAGHAGLAVFPMPKDPDAPPPDPDDFFASMNGRSMGFLLSAEYADRFEDFDDLTTSLIDRWQDEGLITVEEDEHEGVAYRHLIPVIEAIEGEEEMPAWFDPPGFFGDYDSILIAEIDGVVLISNHLPALEHAIDAMQGREIDSVSDIDAYHSTLAQHPAGSSLQVVGLLTPEAVTDLSQGFAFFLPVDLTTMFDALGLSAVKAYSLALHVGGDGVAEATLGVLAPEKVGLLGLVSTGAPFEPPAFVGPDTAGFWQVNVAFVKIPDLLLRVVEGLPEDERAVAQPAVRDALNFIRPVTDELGPQVYIISGIDLPHSASSAHTTLAARLADDLPLHNVLTTFGESIGLKARDFNGNTIFSPAEEGMGPSIGLGFGHVFLGNDKGVERLMRNAGDAAGAKLSGERGFIDATRPLRPSPVIAGFRDFRQAITRTAWENANYGEMMYELYYGTVEIPDFEPPPREETIREFNDSRPEHQKHFPDPREFLGVAGDQVFEVMPTPDGFRGRLLVHKPRQ